jgi:hypothetical protein
MLFVTDSFLTYTPYLTKEAFEGFGVFKIGQVIRTVKYADHLLLVLQGVTDRPIEMGRWYGMEMNVEKKTKVMRISRQPSPVLM